MTNLGNIVLLSPEHRVWLRPTECPPRRAARPCRGDVGVPYSVNNEEQERRFYARLDDPLRQCKLSPMDLLSARELVRVFPPRDWMLPGIATIFTGAEERNWRIYDKASS